ncbi:hypothetical protein [Planotetraspora kaengkrachanensis]|uniref:DUF1156 domain-containing protein n=1 Tax=Planotetraspora kaengkrachanensis TaxID=575193 RepID=A0A8J3M624_9ACTN|nr:hypothetical protein [Planotetraspora kaengkrachanensis]GIG80005.1 hypothetical protein Pka01_31320 [Planotetraspora kaengkrachanensis]
MTVVAQSDAGVAHVQPHSATSAALLRSPLRHLHAKAVSAQARAESRNREVHLPPISTYRWWARRTEAVNGAIIDAAARDQSGRMLIADVFAGGGVIPLAAATRGHKIYAQDLNPWAATGLAAMLGLPAPEKLREAQATLAHRVNAEVHAAYGTTLSDGSRGLVSHTFRVATGECTACGKRTRMFPYALVTLLSRRERGRPEAFLACPNGHLFQGLSTTPAPCPHCRVLTDPGANYTARRKIQCPCGHIDRLDDRAETWQWEVVLVERSRPGRREIEVPTEGELEAANFAHEAPQRTLGTIPVGQETRVLIRHGFTRWEQLYPIRQRILLERLLAVAKECSSDPAVVRAVEIAIIGSAEMAGHLSRWDRYYLKSYESMAGHRFNLTTLAVEPNVWGTVNSGRGTVLRRLTQLVKAATWLHAKTEKQLVVEGPLLTNVDRDDALFDADVRVVEGSSEQLLLPDRCVHLALTDPPYHDDVQYSELSLPFRAWAQLTDGPLLGEAVVNAAVGQLTHNGAYEDLLLRIFKETRRILRPDGHLIFSYANRSPKAWTALFSALQSAGFRAAGCEIVHSENETDHAKRGVRACTLDLLLDVVPQGTLPVEPHRPEPGHDDESTFLSIVAEVFLKIGSFSGDWQESVHRGLADTAFLRPEVKEAETKPSDEAQVPQNG